MALKTKVIAKINSLTEARYFAAMGVDWLSFYLDPVFPNNIELDVAKDIIEWVQGPKILGAFNGMPIEEVFKIAEDIGLHGLAIGPHYDNVPETDLELIWYLNLDEARKTDVGMVDMGTLFWQDLADNKREKVLALAANTKLYIQINVTAHNAMIMVESMGLEGIVVGGGSEEVVGMQSFEKMDELLSSLTEDSPN